MTEICEQLKQLKLTSGRLFARGYALLNGLSPTKHKYAFKFVDEHPELVARLERKFPRHPRDIRWEKADKFAGSTLVRHCHDIAECLKSSYSFLEDLALFHSQVIDILERLNEVLGPVSYKDGPSEIIFDWMGLFCDALSLSLLTHKTQSRRIIQIYTAACYAKNRKDPPQREKVCNFVESLYPNPVQNLQKELEHLSHRVRQILELIACPLLYHFNSTLTICQSGILSTFDQQLDDCSLILDDDMEIPKDLLLLYLVDIKKLERWVLFGCLFCPSTCSSVSIRTCLSNTLSQAHHLHIFRDLDEPIHQLYRNNLQWKLVELYNEEKARIYGSTDVPIPTTEPTQSRLGSLSFSWKDTRSEVFGSKSSFPLSNLPATRSFHWRGPENEKLCSRTWRSMGSMVTSSFSYSEGSIGNFSETQGENNARTDSDLSDSKGNSSSDSQKEMKKSAKREIRELIDVAEVSATSIGFDSRIAGRVALMIQMTEMLDTAKDRPEMMVHELNTMLTALSLAKDEILWEFTRCPDTVADFKKLDPQNTKEKGCASQRHKKFRDTTIDLSIGQLLEVTAELQSLLLKYRSSICFHTVNKLKKSCTLTAQKIISIVRDWESQTKEHATLLPQLENIDQLIERLEFVESCGEDTHSRSLLNAGRDEFWVWDELNDFIDVWKSIDLILSDIGAAINIGTFIDRGCEDALFDYKKSMLAVVQIGNFVECIAEKSSLKELAFHEAQIQDLIDKAFADNTNADFIFNPLPLFHVFSQFLKNDMRSDDPFKRSPENQFVEIVERCGSCLIMQLEDFIRSLLIECTADLSKENNRGSFPQAFDLLSYCFCALSDFGEVEVFPGFVFSSIDFLTNLTANTIKHILLEQGVQDDGLPRLSHMKALYCNFLHILAELRSMLGFDAFNGIPTILSALSKRGKDTGFTMPTFSIENLRESDHGSQLLDSGSLDDHCFMSFLADRITTDIIRDPKNLGVIFDQKQRRFIRRALDARPNEWVDTNCSLQEMRCLVTIFGMSGVAQLELEFRSLIYESIGALDLGLMANEKILQDITEVLATDPHLIDSPALMMLTNKLEKLPALVDITLQFSRSLLIRQLIADAYAAEMASKEKEGSFQETEEEIETVLENLGLPAATYDAETSFYSSEPVIHVIFQNLKEQGKLHRWMYVPALFAWLAHDMMNSVKIFDPVNCYFSNGLHQLVYTMNSIGDGLEQVNKAEDSDEHGQVSARHARHQFIHLFARFLILYALHSEENRRTVSLTCLLLQSVCSDVISPEELEEMGLPSARSNSAFACACKEYQSK